MKRLKQNNSRIISKMMIIANNNNKNKTKINDLSQMQINKLSKLIEDDWLDVINSLPSIQTGKIILRSDTLKRIEKDTNPANSVLNFMLSRAIGIDELYTSFEKIKLEEGLLFFNKPQTDIKIIKRPSSIVTVNSGQDIEINCLAECFPSPFYEFYNNERKLCDGSCLKIKNANNQDTGDYKCVIKQKKSNGRLFTEEVLFKVKVTVDDDFFSKLTVNTVPIRQQVNIGDDVNLTAYVNEMNLNKIKFEWFKLNRVTKQEEALKDSNVSCLKIKYFNLDDAGIYRCQVTREATNEKIFSINYSELIPFKTSEFDLKIALLIGNQNYESDDEKVISCQKCQTPSYNLTKLSLCDSFKRLKKRLEDLDYLVMSFIDLDSDEYIRALRLARKMCDKVDNVSVLIYVAGHGHNYCHEDFLIPINTKLLLHNNHHDYRGILSQLSLCSLSNLLENFKPAYAEQNISVVCFWDLCRREWIECPSDVDPALTENLKYTIIFCCNIGKNGYEINQEDEELNLRKGPIFLNVLLNNLKPNMTLYDIGVNMTSEIKQIIVKRPEFNKLNNPRLHSTLERIDLSERANCNRQFKPEIDKLYLNNINSEYLVDNNRRKVISYTFLADIFINSLILKVETLSDDQLYYDLECHYPILMERVVTDRENVLLFRLTNFLLAKKINFNSSIKLVVRKLSDGKLFKLDVKLPDHVHEIYNQMNTDDINRYLEDKKKLDYNDNFSISSYDVESESFEATSNDDLTS